MLSPAQLERLEEQRTRYTAAIFIGWMLIVFGGLLGIFFDFEFRSGIEFMQKLSGMEGSLGVLVLAIAAWKRRNLMRYMESEHARDYEAREGAARTMVAGDED